MQFKELRGTYIHNETGLAFSLIPPGRIRQFLFGQYQEFVNEEAFLMSQTLVTQKTWEKHMGSNPTEEFIGDEFPVMDITTNQANEFCKKFNFNIPTSDQWRYTELVSNTPETREQRFRRYPPRLGQGLLSSHLDYYPVPIGAVKNGLGLTDYGTNAPELVFVPSREISIPARDIFPAASENLPSRYQTWHGCAHAYSWGNYRGAPFTGDDAQDPNKKQPFCGLRVIKQI